MTSLISPPTFQHLFTPSTPPFKSLSSSRNRFLSPPSSTSPFLANRRPLYHSHFHSLSRTTSYRCHSYSGNGGWNSSIQDAVRDAIQRVHRFLTFHQQSAPPAADMHDGPVDPDGGDADWDWDRWKKHFSDVDEQERIIGTLKVQLESAVKKEDYKGAARLKVAIAAASSNDIVGRVVSRLNRAVKEEHYGQAASIRDSAGAGLGARLRGKSCLTEIRYTKLIDCATVEFEKVGWWSGISADNKDPYGRIIRITAEHGRYVARGFSPRQLASSAVGAPLFEIFLTVDKKGEYKQQAVYLKRRRVSEDSQMLPPRSSIAATPSRLSSLGSTEDRNDLIAISTEDGEDSEDRDDDSDVAEGFQNILKDMIPGVKVKVLNVTAPEKEKLDLDMISKVIEQLMDEEDEDEDGDEDEDDDEDEDVDDDEDDDEEEEEKENDRDIGVGVGKEDEIIGEGDQGQDEIDMDSVERILDGEEPYGVSVKFGGALLQKLSSSSPSKKLLRVPARVQKKGRRSFSFSIDEDARGKDASAKSQTVDKKLQLEDGRNSDNVMFDFKKYAGTEKIPLQVLKDINRLLHFSLTRAQNNQPLTDTTTFNRLELPTSLDPLNGLYIGAHGLNTSEVIQLRRKFGQWKQDGGSKESNTVEFYEYVEALKLTGDLYVPAGQLAFRAKVGKRNQLPHSGIIPEEFGVIARYRGQGRLAEPGFQNPRWVDGELVILDGKYIKGGPVVGFVYWDPEYHFLVFFNPLRLQE